MNRYKSLDFLRGVAVIIVMAGHFLPGYFSTHIGWSGVDLFFVLSGFFISGILFREFLQNGKIKPGRFLIRRGLKIWPMFYTVLLIELVYLIFKGLYPGTSRVLSEVFFIQNYFEGFMIVTWSLGIEEQFYLILALSLPFIIKFFKINSIVPFCVFIMILCPILRFINLDIHPHYNSYKHFFPLPLRADALCSGILISYFYHFKKQVFTQWSLKNKKLLILTSFIMLLPLFFFSFFSRFILTAGLTLTYLGYSFLVIQMLVLGNENKSFQHLFEKAKILRGISWVGFYSYAIYLVHVFIGFGVVSSYRKLAGETGPVAVEFLLFIFSNILFGYILSLLIERPVLRWRDRIYPS